MAEVTIDGRQIDLADGRHVFVGKHNDALYVQFRNAEGQETRLKLSIEAGDALRYLLGEENKTLPDRIIKKFLTQMVSVTERTVEQMAWHAVKTDTAPTHS